MRKEWYRQIWELENFSLHTIKKLNATTQEKSNKSVKEDFVWKDCVVSVYSYVFTLYD